MTTGGWGMGTTEHSWSKAWLPWRAMLLIAAFGTIAVGSAFGKVAAAAHPQAKVAAATIPAGFQDWPMFRRDPLHWGVSAETLLGASNAATLKLHWQVNTGDISYSSPAVVFNATLNTSVVYVGNQKGMMSAYNAATGKPVWTYSTPKTVGLSKEIETSPAVYNNVVYFGDGDGHLYALNATTGSFICRSATSAGGVIAGSPLIANPDGRTGDVVVYYSDSGPSGTTSDGGREWAMYAYGDTAGAQCTTKWSSDNFGSPPGSQAGISGVYASQAFGHLANGTNVVVFGTTDPDDAIYELNATTGAVLWRFQTIVGTDSDVGAPPTITLPGVNGFADGVVYDTGKDAYTYALNLRTGAVLTGWPFNIRKTIGHGNPAQSGASVVGDTVYIGYGAGLFALNATTGALVWTSSPATPGVVSMPSISGAPGNQVIFYGDIQGGIHAAALTSGKNLFDYATGALIFSSAAVSTGQFFITSSNGVLYAFGK